MTTLSVIIPVFNEREDELAGTLAALQRSLEGSSWEDPEIIVVDDGSDPAVTLPAQLGPAARVLRQVNRGRIAARRAGLEAARGDHALLLDARTTLAPEAMGWVADRVAAGEAVWNGHCTMANPTSPYARFWTVITHAAWSDYLDDPRTTWFDLDSYDRFPKGATHFLAPRRWLLDAIEEFESHFENARHSSDDTHLLRAIAARDRIHISPEFASRYRNRDALRPFLTHTVRRGTVFYDGYARPGARCLPVSSALRPVSIVAAIFLLRHPSRLLGTWFAGSALAGGFAMRRRRPGRDALAFSLLAGPFTVAFTAGLWRAAVFALRLRLTR